MGIIDSGFCYCRKIGYRDQLQIGERSNNKKCFPFCSRLGNANKSVVFLRKREKVNNREKKVHGPGPVILGNLLSASVLKIFIFRSSVGVQVQSGFGAFFRCDT